MMAESSHRMAAATRKVRLTSCLKQPNDLGLMSSHEQKDTFQTMGLKGNGVDHRCFLRRGSRDLITSGSGPSIHSG